MLNKKTQLNQFYLIFIVIGFLIFIDSSSIDVKAQEESRSKSRLIGQGGFGWNFDIIEDNKTEVQIEVEEIDSRTLELTLSSHINSNLPANYKWHMALCNISGINNLKHKEEDAQGGFNFSTNISVNYGKLIDFGLPNSWCPEQNNEGYVLFSSGSKNSLPKHIRLVIPENAASFRIHAGTGSTTVNGSAQPQGVIIAPNENLCIDNNSIYHVAWEGLDDDPYYTNSSDNGDTWGEQFY